MTTDYDIPTRVMESFTKAYAAIVYGVEWDELKSDFIDLPLEDSIDRAEDFLDTFKNWVEGRLT